MQEDSLPGNSPLLLTGVTQLVECSPAKQRSGHRPGLRPFSGWDRARSNRSILLSHICFSLPSPLSKNKYIKSFLNFRQTGRVGEREGEKHQCVVVSHMPPTRYLTCNPGTCPDWESTPQPFGLQACAQSTEPHQPGQIKSFFKERKKLPTAILVVLRILTFHLNPLSIIYFPEFFLKDIVVFCITT